MLPFVVLFTIFVGLVAIYVLFTERERGKKGRPTAAVRLRKWLDVQGVQLPSVERTIDMLNGALSIEMKKSASWEAPTVTTLLPGTPLPQFTVQSVELETNVCFKMVCDICWPACAPGLEMSVTEKGSGKTLSCHLQADVYRGKAHITLERDANNGLLISFEYVHKPVVALSCVVLTPGVKDPELLAGDVANALQEALTGLRFSRAETTAKQYPHVEVLVTPAAEQAEDSLDDVDGQLPLVKMASGGATPSETTVGEPTPTKQEQTAPSPPLSTVEEPASLSCQDPQTPAREDRAKPQDINPAPGQLDSPHVPSPPGQLDSPHVPSPPGQLDSPHVPSPAVTFSTPVAQVWKRSPSYEQLRELPASSPALRSALSPWDSSEHLSTSYAEPSMNSSELSNLDDTFSATSEENYPSTLVYEVGNPGHLRHLVAISSAHAKKLHRNYPHAKKLHLYNDHFFIATHTKQKQMCAVCKEKLTGVFGKQGYQCRECLIWVHKPCHVKAETPCPNSRLSSINLIYPDSVSTASKY